MYFLPLQYLKSLSSMLEEKSVSFPVVYLYSSDECKSLLLNILYMCFQKTSSIPTQTDVFSRSSKLHHQYYSPAHHWFSAMEENKVIE